jgi:DNA repair exonuclease SbcCD ATPase subunit
VAAGGSGSLSLVEQRIQSRRFALNTIREDQIVFYLSQRVLDSDTRSALETIRRLRANLSNREAEKADIERKISAIHREQDRIRQNLEALESGSNLYRRYVSVLEGQEDELESLSASLADAEKKAQAARKALEDLDFR